jgi:hypothetical protein
MRSACFTVAKPVGHDQRGAVRRKPRHGILHRALAFGVKRACRLVQQQIGASRKIARAIAMRCFCPPDNIRPRSPT